MEERENQYKQLLNTVLHKNWVYNAGNFESDNSSADEKQVDSDVEEKLNTESHL